MRPHIIQDSFEALKPNAPALVARFYELLFEAHPSTRELFAAGSMENQHKALISGLSKVVSQLDKPDELEPYLRALGARHVQYGTIEEHYPVVAETLLEVLEEAVGDGWTHTLQREWAAALGLVARWMSAGAQDAVVVAAPEPEPAPVAAPTPALAPAPTPTPAPVAVVGGGPLTITVTLPSDVQEQIRRAVREAFADAVQQVVAQVVEEETRALRERGLKIAV